MKNRTPAAVTANKIIQTVLFAILCCSAMTLTVHAENASPAGAQYEMTID